jgi:hypothetical protein
MGLDNNARNSGGAPGRITLEVPLGVGSQDRELTGALVSPTCSVVLGPVFNLVMTAVLCVSVADLVWETTFLCTARADAPWGVRERLCQQKKQSGEFAGRRSRRSRY